MSAPRPLAVVRCAVGGCGRSTELPWSDVVYEAPGPFDPPEPINSGTGWRHKADYFFCPDHVRAPEAASAALELHAQRKAARLEEFGREWERANPKPDPGWINRWGS